MRKSVNLNLYWGDMHTNIHKEHISMLNQTMKVAEQTLDFFAPAYYPHLFYKKHGLLIESCEPRKEFFEDWKKVQQCVAEWNKPGKFVTFLGYEWHDNRRKYGDHNVFYLNDFQPLDYSNTLPQLYENLKKNTGIAIPHHTAYQVGERGKDWNFHDDDLSPFVEIYSSHGSSEGCDTPYFLNRNLNMGPGTSSGSVQEGLAKGYRLGIIASGDNHYGYPGVWGNGLMGVYANDLTRQSLWSSFLNRQVYGTTGDRIRLEFWINDQFMGSVFRTKGPLHIFSKVTGSHALDRIEVIRNNKVIHTYLQEDKPVESYLNDRVKFKLRVECGWGPDVAKGFKFGGKTWQGSLALPFGKIMEFGEKTWQGSLETPFGAIISVEPCFTYFKQKINSLSKQKCTWNLTTLARLGHSKNPACFAALVFEIEAPWDSFLVLTVDSSTSKLKINEILKESKVIAFRKEIEETIKSQFSLSPGQIEYPDVLWHQAYKVKIHRAVPVDSCMAELNFTDKNPPAGNNFYYLRVTQKNGQMGWSSPIWVDNG